MSIVSKGLSAIGRLVFVGVLLGVFLISMAAVVYMSLNGAEVQVPNITGKDFVESEKELAALGLRIRKRADRESTEKMNTVIEQLPKAGDTVKSGQWISVVVSKAGLTPDQTARRRGSHDRLSCVGPFGRYSAPNGCAQPMPRNSAQICA